MNSSISLLAAASCASLLCGTAGAEAPHAAAIVEALRPYVEGGTLAGAVALVADRDTVLSLDAVGYADIGAQRAMTTDALFWVASQSKPITATAFMMLVDEGKVSLDDPVAKYLPELGDLWVTESRDDQRMVLVRPRHAITVREILSHTSGMPFASALEQPTLDGYPLEVGVRSYGMTPLQFQPGTAYSYSNAGINTAGRLIEVLSGQPYEEFLQQRLLDPLGMRDTTFWPSEEQVARLAKSYRPNAAGDGLEELTIGQLSHRLSDRTRAPMPAGGLFSTAEDLCRFLQMVLNGGELDGHRYLSEASVAAMTQKQTPEGVPDGYGLGWATDGVHYGHGGAFATNMGIDSERGLITVWLVQHAGYPGNGAESQEAFMRAAQSLVGGTHSQ